MRDHYSDNSDKIMQYTMYICGRLDEEIIKKSNDIYEKTSKILSDIITAETEDDVKKLLPSYLSSLKEVNSFLKKSINSIEKVAKSLIDSGADESDVKNAIEASRDLINQTIAAYEVEILAVKESIRLLDNSDYTEAFGTEDVNKKVLNKVKNLLRTSHAKSSKLMKMIGTKVVRLIAAIKVSVRSKIKEMANKKKESK